MSFLEIAHVVGILAPFVFFVSFVCVGALALWMHHRNQLQQAERQHIEFDARFEAEKYVFGYRHDNVTPPPERLGMVGAEKAMRYAREHPYKYWSKRDVIMLYGNAFTYHFYAHQPQQAQAGER